MARRHALIPMPRDAVWAVLCDGGNYERWVIGTHETEEVDEAWPEPGSQIHYTVRCGRWTLHGCTIVRVREEGERLELEARAGFLGTARIAIELREWGDGCLVIVDEHPLSGPGARLHNFALEAFIQARHRRMLSRLSRLVQETGSTGSTGGEGAGGTGEAARTPA